VRRLKLLNEIRPGSDVLISLAHLQSQAIRHVQMLREWKRTGADAEPFPEIEREINWMRDWLRSRADLLGTDRLARIKWRRIPQQWSGISTRTEAVGAWLQLEENVAHEIARIENARAFVISLSSAAVAIAALGVAVSSFFVQLLR